MTAYRIVGYAGCGFHQRAVAAARTASAAVDVVELQDHASFLRYLLTDPSNMSTLLGAHRTSPAVFLLPTDVDAHSLATTPVASFVGGCDDLLDQLGVDTTPISDTSSRDPASVLDYFEKVQREKSFVIWVLWRGVW